MPFCVLLLAVLSCSYSVAQEPKSNSEKSIASPVKLRPSSSFGRRNDSSVKESEKLEKNSLPKGEPDQSAEKKASDSAESLAEVSVWLDEREDPNFKDNLSYLLSLHTQGLIVLKRINIVKNSSLPEGRNNLAKKIKELESSFERGSLSPEEVERKVRNIFPTDSTEIVQEAGFRVLNGNPDLVPWSKMPEVKWTKEGKSVTVGRVRRIRSLVDKSGELRKSYKPLVGSKEKKKKVLGKFKVRSFIPGVPKT